MAALLYCLLTPMLGLSTVHTGVARVRCTRVRCIHASAPNDAHEAHMREVQKLHAGIADASASAGGAGSSLTEHNKRQSAVFDEASAFFASADATPPDVVPLLREIVAAAELAPGSSVLDVGTGTGALVPFYEELGLSQGSITGVDLSPKMIAYAAERYPEANFLCADILAVSAPGAFDAVVINACFGNMHDQQLVLEHAASLVRTGGRVLIAHPLGASFVEQLQQDDPGVVPHSLPTRDSLLQMSLGTPLRLERFEAEEGKPYVALLNRSPVAPLPKLRALRGAVATGFGRGSKKLGVPTANLPCSLFQDELDDLERGVYIGWAAVRGEVHKCVANVGFSPTFADEQNPEKIVEAHILNQFDGDFYGEAMSLLLLGFVRPERKFGSLDELIATIKDDISTAGAELERSPLRELAHAEFLRESARADAEACYEELHPASVFGEVVSAVVGFVDGRAPPLVIAAGDAQAGDEARADAAGLVPPEGFSWGISV